MKLSVFHLNHIVIVASLKLEDKLKQQAEYLYFLNIEMVIDVKNVCK